MTSQSQPISIAGSGFQAARDSRQKKEKVIDKQIKKNKNKEVLPDMIISENLKFKGNVNFEKLLRIDGTVEGQIIAPVTARLVIGQRGSVYGNILGIDTVMIEGKLVGNANARVVCLKALSVVHGDISCLAFSMHASAVFLGKLHCCPGGEGGQPPALPLPLARIDGQGFIIDEEYMAKKKEEEEELRALSINVSVLALEKEERSKSNAKARDSSSPSSSSSPVMRTETIHAKGADDDDVLDRKGSTGKRKGKGEGKREEDKHKDKDNDNDDDDVDVKEEGKDRDRDRDRRVDNNNNNNGDDDDVGAEHEVKEQEQGQGHVEGDDKDADDVEIEGKGVTPSEGDDDDGKGSKAESSNPTPVAVAVAATTAVDGKEEEEKEEESKDNVTVRLLLLDLQEDFYSTSTSTVGSTVRTAMDDTPSRIAEMVLANRDSIDEIYVCLDTRQSLHICLPDFWINVQGEHPAPGTEITAPDVQTDTWTPADETLKSHCEFYLAELSRKGVHKLVIRPAHTVIGTEGHAMVSCVNAALQDWVGHRMKTVTYVSKGSPLTDAHSALAADVELPSLLDADASTHFKHEFMRSISAPGKLVVCGHSLSGCVNYTVRDIVAAWGERALSDIVILADGCSAELGDGKEDIGKVFLVEMEALGLTVSSTTNVFKETLAR